jgi:hydroxyacyl-ACP dehydratase HTD2-like protein with hotdog domain
VTAAGPGLAAAVAGWAPEPTEAADVITAGPAIALAGLLDAPPPVTGPGDPLPPLWHWLYFLARPAERELGPDGHPAAGPFMPPIPRRRRMFAGGRVTWHAPVRCGDELTRRSELAGWTVRAGRTGELLFVTVRDTLSRAGRPVITEEQDLVYRSSPAGPEAGPAPVPAPAAAAVPVPAAAPAPAPGPDDPWRLTRSADPVLLFRFSALTYNAHRIHYDAAYATGVEGHRGLVVHGPLLAVLMLELPRRHLTDRSLAGLTFRARSPLYAGDAFTVSGGRSGSECNLRVIAPAGHEAMTAQARLAPGREGA